MSKKSNFPEKRKIRDEEEEFRRLLVPPAKGLRNLASSSTDSVPVLSWQPYLPQIEHFFRIKVREVVEDVVSRHMTSISTVPRNQIQAGPSKQYRLHFCNNLPKKLFTNSIVEAEGSKPIEIIIMDCISNKPVTQGPFSSLKVEILVLDGDFCSDVREECTKKEFESSILRKREGKRPLLTGNQILTLSKGSVCIGDIKFTDNSSCSRSGMFRLGARIYQNGCADNVLEAVTGAFAVRDDRGKSYQKHHPPSLADYVWRLEMIHRNGALHERLKKFKIFTVGDFLKNLVRDEDMLRNVLGNGMSKNMWNKIVKHAWECIIPNNKFYKYHRVQGVDLLFNPIHQLVGAGINNCYYRFDDIPAIHRELVNKLKQEAYRYPDHIIEASEEDVIKITQGLLLQEVVDSTIQTPSWHDQHITHKGELLPLPSSLNIPFPLLENVSSGDEIFTQPTTSQVQQSTSPTYYPNSWNDYEAMQSDSDTSRLLEPIRTPEEAFIYELAQILAGENSGAQNVSVSTTIGIGISVNWMKLLTALKWLAIAKRSRKASIQYPPYSHVSSGVCIFAPWD